MSTKKKVTKKTAQTKTSHIVWNEVLRSNKEYKQQSLSRIIKHLNNEVVVTSLYGNLTIQGLKLLVPEYFKQNKRNKEGKIEIVDRVTFTPFVFLRELRKIHPSVYKYSVKNNLQPSKVQKTKSLYAKALQEFNTNLSVNDLERIASIQQKNNKVKQTVKV